MSVASLMVQDTTSNAGKSSLEIDDDGRSDGAISEDGQVIGTYCHGLFDQPQALTSLLTWVSCVDVATVDFVARREADLNRLADTVEAHLDWAKLDHILEQSDYA